MRAIKRLSALSLLLGIALATSSCGYFRAVSAAKLYNKGVELQKQKNMDGALAAYDELIETYGKDTGSPDVMNTLCSGMYNEAVILNGMPQNSQRIKTLEDQLISTCATDPRNTIRGVMAGVMYNKSVEYDRLKKGAQATQILAKVVDTYANDTDPNTRQLVASAMGNLGLHLADENRFPEAASTFRRMISTYAGDKEPDIREQRAKAIYDLGVVLERTQQPQEAIDAYQQVIDTYSRDTGSGVRGLVAMSMQSKAQLVQAHSLDEALVIFEQVVKTYGEDRDAGISWTVGYSLNAAAFKRLLIAKREWSDRARALAELHAAQDELNASLARIPSRSWTLGNLAYVQWLLGDPAAAAQSFASALDDPKNGGATIYKDTLGDLARFPIREDAGFHKMLDQEWLKYGSRHPGSSLG